MAAFSNEMAGMVALFMGSVGYGINLLTFFMCITSLTVMDGRFKSFHNLNHMMVVASSLMFFIATFDMGVAFQHDIKIFVQYDPKADVRVVGLRNFWSMANFATFLAQTFIGDAILIYRCWIVWRKNWYIITVPSASWISGTACGIAALVVIGKSEFAPNNQGRITPYMTSMMSLTLATNFMSSSFIVYRIWHISKKSSPYRTNQSVENPLARAIRVTIEAGLLYTVSVLILVATYSAGHRAQNPMGRSIIQIIGITFNLVISRNARKTSDTSRGTMPLEPLTINTEVFITRDSPRDDLSYHSQSVVGQGSEKGRVRHDHDDQRKQVSIYAT